MWLKNTPQYLSDGTKYANDWAVNTTSLAAETPHLSSGEGWVHSGRLRVSFVSYVSSLKRLLYYRSARSISRLSAVKKHNYHALLKLWKTHVSTGRGLPPTCWGGGIMGSLVFDKFSMYGHFILRADIMFPREQPSSGAESFRISQYIKTAVTLIYRVTKERRLLTHSSVPSAGSLACF